MTTVNAILTEQNLPVFPLHAWLHHETAKNSFFPDWTLFYDWAAPTEEPRLCFRNLECVDLGGAACYVLHGTAVKPMHGRMTMTDDDEVEFIYVMNPSDPEVRNAVASWMSRQLASHRVGAGWGFDGSISAAAKEFAKQQSGTDADHVARSTLLASTLLTHIRQGRLEQVLASKLKVERPVYCTIVETDLMLDALAALVVAS